MLLELDRGSLLAVWQMLAEYIIAIEAFPALIAFIWPIRSDTSGQIEYLRHTMIIRRNNEIIVLAHR